MNATPRYVYAPQGLVAVWHDTGVDYESVHHAALTDAYGKDQHFEVEINKVKPEVCESVGCTRPANSGRILVKGAISQDAAMATNRY
ncbi:hypothetical protein N7G274_000361 [Stereocaulon virgatum]|uniref:Uncharacterized protein n=1 Tax=Stereocaulon virgatum TaxID=373712 RepID=A0ABR4ARX5_9LECA